MILLVMGVSGAGKTTVGRLLAAALKCDFIDGDDLHPAANIAKMSSGIPLTDEDRAPWLASIRAHVESAAHDGRSLVVACSALRQKYRDFLGATVPVTWIYLEGSPELLHARLEARKGHFMKAGMLNSQIATLEPPASAITEDAADSPDVIVKKILAALPG